MKDKLKNKLPGLSFYVGCEETADALLDSVVEATVEIMKTDGSWGPVLADYGLNGLPFEMTFQEFLIEYYFAPVRKD